MVPVHSQADSVQPAYTLGAGVQAALDTDPGGGVAVSESEVDSRLVRRYGGTPAADVVRRAVGRFVACTAAAVEGEVEVGKSGLGRNWPAEGAVGRNSLLRVGGWRSHESLEEVPQAACVVLVLDLVPGRRNANRKVEVVRLYFEGD